jgi:hypothetical protein
MYQERNYCIFSTSELDKIDFEQVCETSADTVRRSVDGTKTFVKWDGETPSCISMLNTASPHYTHEEILQILSTEEWTSPQGISEDDQ